MQLQDVADKIGESMGHLAMDGIAVSQQLLADAIRGAFAFLAAMPIGFPLPSAGATADGEVMLEWWGNRTNSLIVSVSPSGRVAFSSRCYGESINGEFSVARGQLPAAFVLAAQRWWRAGRRDPSSQRV